jgi:poly-gamma-glutamate system protein
LQKEGICSEPPAAVSLGGDKDIGLDFEPEFRQQLLAKIRAHGLRLLWQENLAQDAAERISIYEINAKSKIAAFVNCGGAYANLGSSANVLKLKPGLNREVELPPFGERGVLYAMAARKIPVLHLLFIKGLVLQYGLPWDPMPLPQPGKARLQQQPSGFRFQLICAAYFFSLLLIGGGPRLFLRLLNLY